MAFSKDNMTGIILALLSSVFIGASFIIKKKGLRRAAAVSGVRAVIVGEIANFVAYAFAPAVLVTPLGALSIIVSFMAKNSCSAVLAQIILKEKLHPLGVLGCVLCIIGSVVIVVHAPQEHPISSVKEIWYMATQKAFLLYMGSVIVLVFILVFYFAPQCGRSNVLVFTGICSLMGSLSVMSVKALGTSLKLTVEGKNQLIYPETWAFMFIVAVCVVTQMNYLNKAGSCYSNCFCNGTHFALDTFNTAVVSPIYYVMFTTLTIVASVIMFKDWDEQNIGSITSEICGFIVVLSGTILLHVTKDVERSSSFRGNYTPTSPSLSTRLCNSNGQSHKHEVEDESFAEEADSRRQDLQICSSKVRTPQDVKERVGGRSSKVVADRSYTVCL
ncbi:hypothetical protein RDI58_027308 [Solanum bulbocastanum]|uniref:Probable magnesium transporter n=1 Tax=Solanum bulbocastanum TaxID=147425 RepID=A0AAN8Y294_SOLBU